MVPARADVSSTDDSFESKKWFQLEQTSPVQRTVFKVKSANMVLQTANVSSTEDSFKVKSAIMVFQTANVSSTVDSFESKKS